MENKEKILESAQELKSGLNLLSRDRKVVMPHNKAFDHVDKLKSVSYTHLTLPTKA